ncbi:MAG: lytic transglycosylase, partial [Deltaproteobacteria bacterium]
PEPSPVPSQQKAKPLAEKPRPPRPSQPSPSLPKKLSDQELLDSALEFCQTASDYWEHGDLDNALDALDQAYSLILKVDGNGKPEIDQQKDDLRFTISKRIIEVYTSRFTVASGNGKEIPLVMNKYVKQAIRLFQTGERKFFLNAYRRSGRYRPAIVKALREAGLPEELSWLPLIESGFKIRALSKARALGLWQFIASTGYKYGLKRDRWIDERMDPDKSTKAAIAYLKELHRIFGDWTTALAAYNCGEGTVLRCIRTQHVNYMDNFWDLYEKLPMETAFYVPKFLAVLHILANPETYGFALPDPDTPVETETVTIDKQVHLKTIARHLNISYELLRELNPELRLNSTPNRPYALRIPKGKGAVLLAKLKDIPVWRPPVPAYIVHRVRRGETLSTIAKRYRSSVRAIVAFNGLRSARFIRAGWKLKIPLRGTKVSRRPAPTPKKISLTTPSSTGSEFVQYTVRRGDSLWKIARRFGTTTKAIRRFNQLSSPQLRIGQILYIPKTATIPIPFKTKPYKVLEGDSPFMIAQKHQMSLSEFLKLNHLTPRSTIFPGQIVLVKSD